MYQRMPEKKTGIPELRRKVHEKTGYSVTSIGEVLDVFFEEIGNELMDKNSVSLPHIGILYPYIKPEKNVVRINNTIEGKGAELMKMPARWVCKFKVKSTFAKKLLDEPPTPEEIEKIYK